jgi:hypothetical protein
VVAPIVITPPWGVVRGAPELVPPSHIATAIPLLALRRTTGYAGSQQINPGVLQPVPVDGSSGETTIFRPMDVGVADGEA